MSSVYKMTEIVGCSPKSFADAVNEAVKRASKTLRNLRWFEVIDQRGLIKDGQVEEFQATIKVGFRLDEGA
jgi:dodecin